MKKKHNNINDRIHDEPRGIQFKGMEKVKKAKIDLNKEPIKPLKPASNTNFIDLEPTKFELDLWAISDELTNLLLSKHNDYGPKNISMSPGGPLNGLRVRMWDKIARINNLMDNNRYDSPAHESLEDSFADLANYAIIGLMVLKGQWPTE